MSNNDFNLDRDILIVERPNNVHVRGALIDFRICADLAEAEDFLRHDELALEAADCGARVFYTTFEQPADIWLHDLGDVDQIDADTAADIRFHELRDEGLI